MQLVQRKPVDEVLAEVARDLVLRGSRAGSVYQAMLNIGYTVSIEDCRAAVDAALAN